MSLGGRLGVKPDPNLALGEGRRAMEYLAIGHGDGGFMEPGALRIHDFEPLGAHAAGIEAQIEGPSR